MTRAWVLAIVAACGGGSPPAGPAAGAPAAPSIATAAGTDDAIVATVNDRPVWASCVRAQAQAMEKPDLRAALDECIAFELMAQEAETRGHATAPEVIEATRTALVNRLVETAFEARYAKPQDFGPRMDQWLADNAWRLDRPELRASTYVRVELPEGAAADLDAKGKALAQKIYAALAAERGLTAPEVSDTAAKLAADSGLTVTNADPPMQPRDTLDTVYADALFAIPEVGRVAPPVRTKWGWDVILWTDGLPALKQTREQLAASAFPDLRRGMFTVWVNGIVKESGVKIQVHSERLQ